MRIIIFESRLALCSLVPKHTTNSSLQFRAIISRGSLVLKAPHQSTIHVISQEANAHLAAASQENL